MDIRRQFITRQVQLLSNGKDVNFCRLSSCAHSCHKLAILPPVLIGGEGEVTFKTYVHTNKQREIIALDRQRTQRQRPESPTVSAPGVRVNTRYINSTEGTSSKKDAPSGMYILYFRHIRRPGNMPLTASFFEDVPLVKFIYS